MEPIQQDDTRYKPSVYHGFGTFEEAEKLLYCNRCRFEADCNIPDELWGENYPFFAPELIRLDLKFQPWEPWHSRLQPEEIICKVFKPRYEFLFLK